MSYGQLSSLTNLETLIINNVNYDMPLLYEAFGYSIPQTFKNIVLKDCGYKINKNMFYNITGINIFIDEYKENLMWNEDTPNWNNGNKVYYKGDWTKVEFFDENNTWIDTQYRTISEIIKQPHVSSKIDNEYSTIFIGWDIDGDGIVDSIPATSTTDIIAKAIKQTLKTEYVINFIDYNGETISSSIYDYNDEYSYTYCTFKKRIYLYRLVRI